MARRCPATSTLTWQSPAAASPGFGPRTTCASPIPGCGSPCSSVRSPDSARRAATVAGARRCFPPRSRKLARMAGRAAAIAMHRAMQATVDEVGRVAAAEGIDCHWSKGGTVQLARSQPQLERAKDEVAQARAFGFGEDDLRLLSASEAQRHARRDRQSSAAPTRRTAPPSIRPGSPAASPPRCGVSAWRCTSGRRRPSIEPRRVRTAGGHGAGRARDPCDRGLHTGAAQGYGARSRPCTPS